MTRNIFKVVYLVIFTILSGASLCAQNFEVDVEIKGYTNDTLIVGNYFGEKQIVKDTLFAISKGKFVWSRAEKPEQGVYLFLLKPENTFLQFIVNDYDTKFSIKFDAKDLVDVSFKGSVDNKVFYEYLTFLKVLQFLLFHISFEFCNQSFWIFQIPYKGRTCVHH